MGKGRFCAAFLALLLAAALALPASAAGRGEARLVFSASVPDAGGFFTVDVTAYDMTFDIIQLSFNFDPAVVEPAAWDTGKRAAEFSACAKVSDALKGALSDGYLPKDQGLVNTVAISATETYTAGAEGLLTFSYRFRKIAEGAAGLALATSETGKAYNEVIPDGFALYHTDKAVEASCVFRFPAALTGGAGDREEAAPPVLSKAERQKNTLILQIGNYAAAKDGVLCHIYPGEKDIAPYFRADRAMVPLRFIAERLGAEVSWDNETRTATVTLNRDVLTMKIGMSEYTVNGVTKSMDAAAELQTGVGGVRTMVPMRFAAEALGKAVHWDAGSRLIIITERDRPWQSERAAEKGLTRDVLQITSPLLRDLIS